MSWTKLGDEWGRAARDLSDGAYRMHVDALGHSNAYLLDLMIPKRDLRRFAECADPDAAVAELVDTGWWQDCGDAGWHIGVRFANWQLERAVVEARQQNNADRQRRFRLHQIGDHSICKNCSVTRDVTRYETRDETRDPGRVGSGRERKDKSGLERGTDGTGGAERNGAQPDVPAPSSGADVSAYRAPDVTRDSPGDIPPDVRAAVPGTRPPDISGTVDPRLEAAFARASELHDRGYEN